LAGVPQEFVVRYFDSEGPLSGNGLAEVVLPVAGRPCESTIDVSERRPDEFKAVMDALALGFSRELTFRGVAEPPPVLPEACKSTLLSTCEPSSQEPTDSSEELE